MSSSTPGRDDALAPSAATQREKPPHLVDPTSAVGDIDHEHDHDHGHDHDRPSAIPVSAGLWLIVSVMITLMSVTGHAGNYVRSFWVPILGVVGILVAVLAATTLYRGFARQGFGPMQHIGWLLVIPAAIIVVSAPSPLGASMLANSTSGSSPSTTPRIVLTKTKAGKINYPALNNTANELTIEQLSDRFNFDDEKKLIGKPITIVGFVSHGETGGDPDAAGSSAVPAATAKATKGFVLNRFKIYCCAADAIAYSAHIVTSKSFPDDTWLKVTGHVVKGAQQLTLQADTITTVHQPQRPYL